MDSQFLGHSYVAFLTKVEQNNLPLASFNEPLQFLDMFLLEGKFYSLFLLLFGLGFSLIMSSARGNKVIVRRLLVLIGFGLLHSLLVWGLD